jgi:hypothetical protein
LTIPGHPDRTKKKILVFEGKQKQTVETSGASGIGWRVAVTAQMGLGRNDPNRIPLQTEV